MPFRRRHDIRRPSLALALTAALALGVPATHAGAGELASVQVQPGTGASPTVHDGVVEALRQTVIAAQVSGAVVELPVRAGDRVKSGQLLLRLDARAANQGAAASDAQVRAARAAQEVAAKEFARQQQLAADKFISAAALDRAQAEFKAAQAQAEAQLAQAGATRTQTGFYVVRAPYAGVISEVSVTLGEMAMPGRALVTLYDPNALRISASVPQSAAATLGDGKAVRAEIPALASATQRTQTPLRVQVLPAADAATHTVTVRADLPPDLSGAMPGQFARLWWPSAKVAAAGASPWVPLQAIVRRAEMTGLYVLDPKGQPLLRQVRLGRNDGINVEVLSGLSAGERVAIDAQAAARLSASSR